MIWLKNNRKNKIALVCGLVSALMVSMVQLPAVYAAESCFEAVGDTVDYDHGNTLHAKVKATCDMELQSIAISFADTEKFEGIEELTPESLHSQISEVEISDDHLHLQWNTDESASYANILSGEELFSMAYHVPINTTVFKRNMPITIESAQYKIGDEIRTEENVNLDAMLIVTHDSKEALMVAGIEKQDVSYIGGPIALEGDLVVEDNPASITANDLGVTYYNAVMRVDDPSEPGDYVAVYSYEDDNYVASLKVPFTIRDYYTIDVRVFAGEGEISAPHYVDAGEDVHVEIIPGENHEIAWVDYNGENAEDRLNEDNSLDITNINEDAEIVVSFWRTYNVTSGNGGEHVLGSSDNLAFMIDKDPYSYTDGDVLIMVDGEYVDLLNDSVVEPLAQTTTLLSDYLNTLEIGEHNFEILFFDTDAIGVARATFTIIEASESEEEGENVLVPNTGGSTEGVGGAEMASILTVLSVVVTVMILLVVKRLSIRKD